MDPQQPQQPMAPQQPMTPQPPMTPQQQPVPQQQPQQQQVRPAVDSPGVRPARSMIRTLLGIVSAVLFALALVLLVRLFMAFFEPLATLPIYKTISTLTAPLVLPLGIKPIATPFKGFFEVNTVVTIVAILVVEYLLGAVRRNT